MKTKNDTLPERLAVLFGGDKTHKQEAAKQCEVDVSTVGKWIAGSLAPSMENVKILAKYFDTNFLHLLHGRTEVRRAYEYYQEHYGEEHQAINKDIDTAYSEALIRLNRELIDKHLDSIMFNAVLDDTEDEIYVMDKEFGFISASKKVRSNLGYSCTEMEKLNARDIKKDVSDDYFDNMAKALKKDRDPIRFLATHKKRDGRRYQLELMLQQVKVNNEPHYLAIGTEPAAIADDYL